jgi:hypothetical protein
MILPKGITGFNVPNSAAQVDLKLFTADCWAAATAKGGRLEDRPQTLPGAPTSFIARLLVLDRVEIAVLLNAVHPWVGFCLPLTPGHISLEFVDHSPIATALAATGRYHILTKQELECPVTDDKCGRLTHGEVSQLKYWSHLVGRGKMRVGDVVFNFWD